MSHHAEPCVTGCTTRGAHTDTAAEDTQHTRTCRGCHPRPAEHGLLCGWCWQRLVADVAALPHLVQHLRVVGTPTAAAAAPTDGLRTHADPAEGAVIPDAWHAADELHALLASWCDVIADSPRMWPPLAPPPTRGGWHVPAGVAGVTTAGATARLVAWVQHHLAWAARQQWAGAMRTELGVAVASASARWPVQDTRTRRLPGVHCTGCQRDSLIYTPTTGHRRPATIACSHPECGRLYTEDEHDRLTGVSA